MGYIAGDVNSVRACPRARPTSVIRAPITRGFMRALFVLRHGTSRTRATADEKWRRGERMSFPGNGNWVPPAVYADAFAKQLVRVLQNGAVGCGCSQLAH